MLVNNSGRAEKGKVREHTVRWCDGREWPPWSADYSATNILLIRRQAVRARSQNAAAWWAGPAAERWRASGRHWCVRSHWQPWVWFVLTRVIRCLSAWRSILQVKFFSSYSWMMRQNVGDTASCWESALPLHCRHFRRESVSPSAYIYIYIFTFIYTQVKCTLQGNKLLREKQTQRLNGRRLLPQTGESWTVTRLESACISCKYHILHNSEVGYILTKYNHRWLHLPGGVLHSTRSLFSESKLYSV